MHNEPNIWDIAIYPMGHLIHTCLQARSLTQSDSTVPTPHHPSMTQARAITGLLAKKGGWSACVPDGEHERTLARQADGQDLLNKCKRPNLAVLYPIRAHFEASRSFVALAPVITAPPPFPGGASNLLMHHAPRLVVRS